MIPRATITNAIKALNVKIKELREKCPTHELLPQILHFYQTDLTAWVDNIQDEKLGEKTMDEILKWMTKMNDAIERCGDLENPSENIINKSQLKPFIKEVLKVMDDPINSTKCKVIKEVVSEEDFGSEEPSAEVWQTKRDADGTLKVVLYLDKLTIENLKYFRDRAKKEIKDKSETYLSMDKSLNKLQKLAIKAKLLKDPDYSEKLKSSISKFNFYNYELLRRIRAINDMERKRQTFTGEFPFIKKIRPPPSKSKSWAEKIGYTIGSKLVPKILPDLKAISKLNTPAAKLGYIIASKLGKELASYRKRKKNSFKNPFKESYQVIANTGEWVEPNGNVHKVGSDSSHWVWADDYLKSIESEKRFKDDPVSELVARGWMRVVYDNRDYVIMVMTSHRTNKYLTRVQKEYLEDEAERKEWAVKDDNGYTMYVPHHCMSKGIQEDHGLGYSHNVSFDVPNGERDPLNDPLLIKEAELQYRFDDFKWLGNVAGFGVPTDVYYGTVYLGTIESRPDGYVLSDVKGPTKLVRVVKTGKNPVEKKYKTKNDAAKKLHKLWKHLRNI